MASTPCAFCKSTHVTSDTFSEARLIELPDGRACHFKCLRVWLAEDAIDRWFGRMPSLERRALMIRLGLPVESGRMPGVKEVAPKVGRSFPWVSNIQRDAMRKFFKRSADFKRKPDEDRARRGAVAEVKELLSSIEELAQAADERVDAIVLGR
jgi:hypothetical protein